MNATEAETDVLLLHQVLELEVETGLLFWKKRDETFFKNGEGRYTASRASKIWNARYAGKPAFFSPHSMGYLQGTVFYKDMLAHRVVWAMYHGSWPAHSIDHINGIKNDNRPVNLRDVPHDTNMKNQRLRQTNKTGITGVWYRAKNNRFDASINVNGKKKHIGSFQSLTEAASARKVFSEKNGYHANHGRDQ